MSSDSAKELQRDFGIAGVASFDEGPGGLVCLTITSELCDAELYLHGGQVTHFQPAGQRPVLFLSRASEFDPARPIRGGVPICFPWFGAHPQLPSAPAHGTARLSEWTVESLDQHTDGSVSIALTCRQDELSLRFFRHDFVARLRLEFSATLAMTLEVHNPSSQSMRFEQALHSYLLVDDVRQVSVEGLNHSEYFDKTRGGMRTRQAGTIRITGETDRIYFNTPATCILHDPVARRTIRVEKSQSLSTIIWNPWIDKARALHDFGDDEWPNMLCIETANVGANAIKLPPGGAHAMSTRIAVAPI